MIRKRLELMITASLIGLLSSCADTATLISSEAAPFPEQSPAKPSRDSGPAGILLYCRLDGEILILVANDRLGMRGWAGFGGGDKKGETAAMTAARETSEETRGYYRQPWLFRKIADQRPVKQWGYHFYFAEVAHVSAKTIMKHRLPRLSPAYLETQHYAWVPFSELKPLLTKKTLTDADLRLHPRHLQPGSNSGSYWRVWIDNMRHLHLKDAFPWSR